MSMPKFATILRAVSRPTAKMEDFMPTYTQSNRYIKVTTPLGTDALLLTG